MLELNVSRNSLLIHEDIFDYNSNDISLKSLWNVFICETIPALELKFSELNCLPKTENLQDN